MQRRIKNLIQSKLLYLPIKKKLYFAFGTILAFMLVVVLVTMIGLLVIRSNINEIVDEHEPTVIAAIELGKHIKAASSSLGFYLLSTEKTHKDNYENDMKMIDATLAKLKRHKSIQDDQQAKTLVTDIETEILKFKQYQSTLFDLAVDPNKNIPGIAYAAENLNPISQQILQILYEMISSESEESANKKRKQILIEIEALRYNWTNVMNGVRAYLAYRGKQSLDDIQLYKAQVNKLFNELHDIKDLTFEQSDGLVRIAKLRDEFFANLDKLIEIHGSDQWRQDAHLVRTQIGPILRATNEKLVVLEKIQRDKINKANTILITQVAAIIIIGLVLLVASIYAASMISIQLVRNIVDPLNKVVDATGRISSGDLTVNLEKTSEDEIGQLISALNIMAANLATLVDRVQKSGIQVTSSSTEIAATAQQQEATVTEQAATANEISTTASEIAATVQELVNTMDDVTSVAETTANSAANSQSALGSMEQTMHQMMDATSSISSKLSVLSEKAANINSVVTTITKVADQTNLLSLNAAIEAEKAGEYGAGFSVVATEIRRLADQTAVATWDIEQMVKEMQSAVSAGVMGMDKFTEEVRSGVNEVRQVGTQLADIIEQVQALLPSFEAVHEGMQNQALGARQITESITQLSDGTQQTAESLRQSTGAISQLNNAARALQDSVSKFKVKTG